MTDFGPGVGKFGSVPEESHTPKKRACALWGTAIDYAVYLSHDTSIRGRCHGCD